MTRKPGQLIVRRAGKGRKPMTADVRCARCGRSVNIDSDEFAAGAATDDGQFICERCATPEEELLAEERVDEVLYEREAWRFDE
jgi:recombinational DNA repair protein (RecF pathway)